MSAPSGTAEPGPAVVSGAWWRLGAPLAIGLALLSLLFPDEIRSAVGVWYDSTAYNHCFLIIPIVIYLVWDRWGDVKPVPAEPMPLALLLCLPIALVWLLAERLGIMEGRQLAVISFAEVLFLAVLGRRLFWALCGPLLYLYFLVPFGAFITPKLQDLTTEFVRHGLHLLGVPAYIDGHTIQIPQGTFFIAQACAGLRFLIASIAFGCLYALVMYRGPVRRTAFIITSMIVPVFANGLRAILIVYLGYLLGSAQAAATDHVLYGWVLFSIVLLILIAAGLPFRQDDLKPTHPNQPVLLASSPSYSMPRASLIALATAVLAAASPAVASVLTRQAALQVATPARIEVGPDCPIEPASVGVRPAGGNERVVCPNMTLDLAWRAFAPRSTAAPIMAARRRMTARARTESLSEHWAADPGGPPSTWLIMNSNKPLFTTAVAIWVGGQPIRPGLRMRLRMALTSLFGSRYAPMVVTVTPVVDWSRQDALGVSAARRKLPLFLATHRAIEQTVGTLSAAAAR